MLGASISLGRPWPLDLASLVRVDPFALLPHRAAVALGGASDRPNREVVLGLHVQITLIEHEFAALV